MDLEESVFIQPRSLSSSTSVAQKASVLPHLQIPEITSFSPILHSTGHTANSMVSPFSLDDTLSPAMAARMSPYEPSLNRTSRMLESPVELKGEHRYYSRLQTDSPAPSMIGNSYQTSEYLRHMHGKTLERYREKIHELEMENAGLKATVQTLENAYKLLATAQPHLGVAGFQPRSRADQPPSQVQSERLTTVSSDIIAASPLSISAASSKLLSIEYDRDKHSKIRFFTRESYRPYLKGGVLHEESTVQLPMPGTSKLRSVPIYLENIDGTVMAADRYKDLRSFITKTLHSLVVARIAPEKWSKMSNLALCILIEQVIHNFPELAECEDYWKIKHLASTMYSDFMRDRSRNSGTSSKKRSRNVEDEDAAATDIPPAKRPVRTTGTPHAVQEIQAIPIFSAPAYTDAKTVGTSAGTITITAQTQTPISPSASLLAPSSLVEPAHQTVSSNSPQSGHDTPQNPSHDIVRSSPSPDLPLPADCRDSPVSGAHPAPETACRPDETGLYVIGDPLASFRDPNAAPLPNPTLAVLEKKDKSPSSPAKETSPPDVDTAGPKVGTSSLSIAPAKKAAKMRVTKRKTARNLYAYTYASEHPAATVPEFDKVWKSLDKDIRQEYDAIVQYALLCPEDSLDSIMRQWATMECEDREKYYQPEKDTRGKKGKERAK
ncbi:hypothetical protein C8Q79DRAFT_967774 [Trametes meyenii]|nr:hypothetical protein C8Q79DRAFT_967774 [Trametes meyenii]